MATISKIEAPQDSPIRNAWLAFVESIKQLLVPQKDNRPLDQYLELRDKVYSIIQSEAFLAALQTAYDNGTGSNYPIAEDIKQALLLELQAFPRALEVVHFTQKRKEKKNWWNRLFGQASTVTVSVKDILAENTPFLKGGLTLLDEVLNLFKKD
ncbi:MAG: hypothetical protein LCH81_21110 [Bacteroidetes bacterium]|nr:hypothetical protein [Bacteroidota bacterium]